MELLPTYLIEIHHFILATVFSTAVFKYFTKMKPRATLCLTNIRRLL